MKLLALLLLSFLTFSALGSDKKISGKITDLEVTYNGEQFIWFKVNGASPSKCNGEKIKAVPPLVSSYILAMHAQNKDICVAIYNSSCTAFSVSESKPSNW